MNDRTKQIVDLVLKAPELLQALKDDPKALASRCGIPDQAYTLLEAGREWVEGYLNRPSARNCSPTASVPTYAPPCNRLRAAVSGQENSVPLVGVVGLASLAGMLSAAAIVAVVAINKDAS